jgi:predicted nuclease of restriction endonuclease-like (RecB) superfamily
VALEILGLKDEFPECLIKDALTHRLERFLPELGNDSACIARQKLLRLGAEWDRSLYIVQIIGSPLRSALGQSLASDLRPQRAA